MRGTLRRTSSYRLELAREEVNTRTHAIVHRDNAVEMQDLELNDREEQIDALVQ
jgi:hypothetical protein